MEDLGMRKISTKMLPLIFTDDQECCIHIQSDILHNAEMFERIIAGDKT
jgi:hypothetical protein